MNKIVEFLQKNDIDFCCEFWGDDYFEDHFRVPGLLVSFDLWAGKEESIKMRAFKKFMARKRSYVAVCNKYGAGYYYRVMTVQDNLRYIEHEEKKAAAVEKFWRDRRGM